MRTLDKKMKWLSNKSIIVTGTIATLLLSFYVLIKLMHFHSEKANIHKQYYILGILLVWVITLLAWKLLTKDDTSSKKQMNSNLFNKISKARIRRRKNRFSIKKGE